MRILVFSDSHGHTAAMMNICQKNPPDAILHLGDCVRDTLPLAAYAPLTAVAGNNDYHAPGVPEEILLDWEGAGIFLCHGHSYGVKTGLERLTRTARSRGAAVALFGHTHQAYVKDAGGLWLCNPGSVSYPYGGAASYGELTVRDGRVEFAVRSIGE